MGDEVTLLFFAAVAFAFAYAFSVAADVANLVVTVFIVAVC